MTNDEAAAFRRSSLVVRQRMSRTGIGLAGIDGVWWLPATEPFALPRRLADELELIGPAIFALLDAVTALYGTAAGETCSLNRLLDYKVPPDIPRLIGPGRVLGVRPDFQLCALDHPSYGGLVATELEICPSAHGFAHALQVGYQLKSDLVAAFARLLGGRELLFVGTSQWNEFLFEQLAFCRALAEVGARGRVLYDQPIAAMAAQIRSGERWRTPMFGIAERPATWDDDMIGRIHAHGFERFVWPDAPDWPRAVGDALVFRFGYFDCFAPPRLQRMLDWQASGATMLNPTHFILDSKVIMAALQLPALRARIAPDALEILARCIPQTLLVEPATVAQLRREQRDWVVKYAGYDHGNLAWGGRSLQVGIQHSREAWARILERCLELPWPVVAQRVVTTARIDIAYAQRDGNVAWMHRGATRLRSFMLRDGAAAPWATVVGTHLTVSSAAMQVSEGTDTVQAPVVFRD
jgi:hypothetical protein